MFSSFTDEELKKAVENGLENYVENSMPEVERDIKRWEYDIQEYKKRIESCEWLLDRKRKELEDLKETRTRIERIKLSNKEG